MTDQDRYRGQHVLVFPTAMLHEIGYFQGPCTDVERYLGPILAPSVTRFVPRADAEDDESMKQLIPYVVLRAGDQVFRYVRGQGAGEARLRAKGSVGIGGHIEPQDEDLFATGREMYLRAAAREVEEEVDVQAAYRERIVGLLNDDSNPVGRVHFGVVHVWDLEAPLVERRERQITQAGFVPLENLRDEPDALESWSQIALDLLA